MKMSASGKLFAILTLSAGLFAGCEGMQTVDTPPLVSSPEQPEKKNWFAQTGENAWNAVASPISGLMPKAKPKPKPVEVEPVSIEPPEVIVITRENRGLKTEEPKPQK
jgi:hypothetical protein